MNNQDKQHRCWFYVGIFMLGLLFPLTLTSGTAISQKTLAAKPVSYPRNKSLYVTARDGTKIAIDVWLPKNLSPKAKIPTIMRTTYAIRAVDFVDDRLDADPISADWLPIFNGDIDKFNNSGYAVVSVDVRGTGASFGNFSFNPSTSKNEIQDYEAVLNWVLSQPWSNQKVGAYGTSGAANTAEFLAVTNNPAVKAVVPRSMDFDPYAQQYFPGGILAEAEVKELNETGFLVNSNFNLCGFSEQQQRPDCQELIKQTGFTGVKPVDKDKDKRLLRAAVQEHANNIDFYQAARQVTYRDDPLGQVSSTEDFSLYNFKDDIERSNVAIYTWASWLDAGTADGVLSHFMTFSNPQKAIIGPWTHGAYKNANPYLPPQTPANPSVEEQRQDIINFFDTYLKDNNGKPKLKREIKYYTMGEEKWKTTQVWPPAGVINKRWFLAENNGLTRVAPTEQTGADKYTVNFEATTGEYGRWRQESSNITFGNRTKEDKKLLTYTSHMLKHDVEITGNPVVTLYASSTANDGAFIVYLEDVDENGKVTYITEGQLRPIHRQVSKAAPPYKVFGPYHSFKRKDSLPLVPGQVNELTFNLLPTSVLIKKGHRIRVAIAGHDKDTFARYPKQGTPAISVKRNVVYASHIDLPVIKPKHEW